MRCSLLEQMYQVNVAGTTVVVGLAGRLFYIYDVWLMRVFVRMVCEWVEGQRGG